MALPHKKHKIRTHHATPGALKATLTINAIVRAPARVVTAREGEILPRLPQIRTKRLGSVYPWRLNAVRYNWPVSYARYPGGDLIERGLKDLDKRRESIDSLLVSIGAPRLRRLGFDIEQPFASPEHRLYELLAQEAPDRAHSRYNALIRRLVSFERALECAT